MLTHSLTFAAAEMLLARKVIDFKLQLENVARQWFDFDAGERRACEAQGLAPEIDKRTGDPIYALSPHVFVLGTLGMGKRRWMYCSTRELVEEAGTKEVDPWLVVGATRKPEWFDPPQEFDVFASRLDQETLAGNPLVMSTTEWIKPFPLLIAGEGKNRVETYQKEGRPLITHVTVREFVPASTLRLYRSIWNSSVWLLRVVGEEANWWSEGLEPGYSVLPFPDVGVPLLQAYGVQVDRGWGWRMRASTGAQKLASRRVRAAGWSHASS